MSTKESGENSDKRVEGILPVKYVFLDVVGFTFNRSVETQSAIVRSLNEIVKSSIQENGIPKDNQILIPTGDGICVALLNLDCLTSVASPYDAHLRIALEVVRRVEDYNKSQDDSHRFQVRIGVNENVDNVVIDINQRLNVAGDGINMAQRIMSIAEGNQILVSSAVFSTLGIRDKYFKSSFRMLPRTQIKHGIELVPYQFVASDNPGLNTELPERFKPREKKEPRLTKTIAYYLAHAIKNEKFFLAKPDPDLAEYPGVILLFVLAQDSLETSAATSFDVPKPDALAFGADIQTQFSYLDSIRFWLLSYVKEGIIRDHLREYDDCFESNRFGLTNYMFISLYGKEKLKREWSEIWQGFSLDDPNA